MSLGDVVSHKLVGAQVRLTRNIKAHARATQLREPIVSFTFDDFPRSALTEGGRILKEAGWAGTYFAAGSFCGRTVDDIDYFTRDDLLRAEEEGHEIACHTFSHLRLAGQRTPAIVDDLARNAAFLRASLPGLRLSSFAYPYGDVRLPQKRLIAGRFPISRGIWPGLNTGRMDFGELKAVALERHRPDATEIQQWLDRAKRHNGWLIFFTHDVSEQPSDYGCTPDAFARVVGLVAKAGIRVLPVKNAAGFARFAS